MKQNKQGLGLVDLFTFGFGAIVGVGWSVTLSNFFINGGGPLAAILGFVLASLALIPVALCFAELAPAIPQAGGAVVYAQRAYGSKMAFITGWFVALAYISILPWEAINVNEILLFMFPSLQKSPVLYTLAGGSIRLSTVVLGLAVGLVIIFINWRGITAAASFQKIMTLILIVGSLICVFFAAIRLDYSNLMPLYAPVPEKRHVNFTQGVITILALAPFFYSGFDTVPQTVEEAKQGKSLSMGRIIVATMLAALFFYVLVFLSVGLAYPWQQTIGLNRPVLSNLFLILYPGIGGQLLYYVCTLATLAGLITTWNGFYIASTRVLVGMSRNGLIPAAFSRMHPKFHTPYVGNLFCGSLMLIGPFLGPGLLDPLTTLGSAGFVLSWGMVCLAVIRLRRTEPELERPYRMPGGTALAWLGAVACGVLLLNCVFPGMPGFMGAAGMITALVWTGLGVGFYLLRVRGRAAG